MPCHTKFTHGVSCCAKSYEKFFFLQTFCPYASGFCAGFVDNPFKKTYNIILEYFGRNHPKCGIGGRIPYLYHFLKGRTHGIAAQEIMEEKNMKKATIRDVAKAAGVSQSTVSRVLNNNGYVGEDARRRVEEAMETLHYSPSAIAVSLSTSRSRIIGVIVPQIFAPFFSQLYYIADRVAEKYGYRLLLCNSDESLKREKELIDDLLSYKIAALLIVPVDGDEGSNKAYLDHIRSTGTPVVCVDREIEGIHCDGVYIDNYTACYEVTKDVLARGYRNIAYMADPPIYRPGCDRLRGFRDACKEFGVTVPQENIFLAPIEDTKPLNAFLHDIARRDVPPKAIINFVRGWDYTMLQALHSAGLRVPEDVYLTGLDDDNTLPNFGYSMQYLPSTIDFSEAAAKLLIERVEAGNALPEPERRIFTTHMKPVFERKVTLPKPDAAPTETDEKEK